jgi:hypothetical protein
MAFALVQTPGTIALSGTGTVSLAFGSNNAQHNLLIAFVQLGAAAVFTNIQDTLVNTWVQVGGFSTDAGGFKSGLFYVADSKAGANTVSVNSTGGGNVRLGILEFSGAANTTPLDTSNATNSTITGNTSVVQGGAITPANAGELILLTAQTEASALTWTVGTGVTSLMTAGAVAENLAYNLSGAAGAQTPTSTISSANNWSGIVAAFKAASGTTPGSAPTRLGSGGLELDSTALGFRRFS